MPPLKSDNSNNAYDSNQTVLINIETMRLQISSFYARIMSRVSIETLRPLPMFLGITNNMCLSPCAFTPPVKKMDKTTPEKITSRIKLNFAYFLTNYVLLAATTALVVALMHPGMVFFLGIVYGLWTLHSFLIRNQLVLFGIHVHSLLNVQQRFYVLFVITTIVVIMKCLVPTLIFIAISGILILSHALLRDPKDVESFNSGFDSDDDDDDLEGGIGGGGNNGSGGEGGGGDSSGSEVMVDRPIKSATVGKGLGSTSRRGGGTRE